MVIQRAGEGGGVVELLPVLLQLVPPPLHIPALLLLLPLPPLPPPDQLRMQLNLHLPHHRI